VIDPEARRVSIGTHATKRAAGADLGLRGGAG